MKKRIIIITVIIVLLIIPLFMFNDTKGITKEKKITKKKNNYPVESENVVEEISKESKFRYITTQYDNINEYIKVSEEEVEEIKYVCVENVK